MKIQNILFVFVINVACVLNAGRGWTQQETDELVRIAEQYKDEKGRIVIHFECWEAIATELNLWKHLRYKRSAVACKQQFESIKKNSNSILSTHKWTQEEDLALEAIISQYPERKHWQEISQRLSHECGINICAKACLVRFQSALSKEFDLVWTEAKDALLLELASVQPKMTNSEIGRRLGTTAKSCRERLRNLHYQLREAFTPEEDKLLLELFKKFGAHWYKIEPFFLGKPQSLLKNRHNFLKNTINLQEIQYPQIHEQNTSIKDALLVYELFGNIKHDELNTIPPFVKKNTI